MKNVSVHRNSGFCIGVRKAVEMAEEVLDRGEKLYCLGEIVHNPVEVKRLGAKGLISIDRQAFGKLKEATVLIRAHGEPPETYETAERNHLQLIDATCPIVAALQKKVGKAAEAATNSGATLLIYGKKGHPEAEALVGHSGGKARVFMDVEELEGLDFTRKVNLFSQTTMDQNAFAAVAARVRETIEAAGGDPEVLLEVRDTVCRHVSHRKPQLMKFAGEHDLLLFVSGRESSNGRTLFAACRTVNKNAYFITGKEDLAGIDLDKASSIGICGATSTPLWLIEHIKGAVKHKLETGN